MLWEGEGIASINEDDDKLSKMVQSFTLKIYI